MRPRLLFPQDEDEARQLVIMIRRNWPHLLHEPMPWAALTDEERAAVRASNRQWNAAGADRARRGRVAARG